MNQLNTNHKLILFPLLLMLIAFVLRNVIYLTWIPNFIFYILPMGDSGLFLPLLGIAIICLSATNKINRIEIALIPLLILLTYFYFPWWMFLVPENFSLYFSYLVSSLVYLGLIFYGTYFLLKDKLGQEVKIIEANNKSYKPTDELSDKEFLPTLLLCLFVGMLGVHRFYVGKIGTGVAMIFTLGGLGIWVLVDFILICIGSFRDIEGRVVKYQRVIVNEQANNTGIAEELEKFAELKEKGIISEEEFNKKKEELL
tara:strand:+ start:169 stop:936 length:768 start_codon:yes stop_codon:yes gene_type:complete